ncbi:MAG: hypothetical protein K0S01_238 [Herbinix sp.]|nr:hypothetical protein [Herbinix sp.]
MELVWSIIIISLILLYDFVVTPKICKKKIYSQINNIGGQIIIIEKLSRREQLYCVNYIVNGKLEKAIIRFNIAYESTWK